METHLSQDDRSSATPAEPPAQPPPESPTAGLPATDPPPTAAPAAYVESPAALSPAVEPHVNGLSGVDPEGAGAKPRRRGRTALLISCAAVLGVLAGAGAGYQIQYERPDTELPPLAQSGLVQPKGPAPAAKPPSADEDHLVKSDGDLRKLLLPKPESAKDADFSVGEDGWASPLEFSETFSKPDTMFTLLLRHDFRREAVRSWGDAQQTATEIRLLQFRDETDSFAVNMLHDQESYMSGDDYAGDEGTRITDTLEGRTWVYAVEPQEGYVFLHAARALARRGNIVMDIWMYSTKPIKSSTVTALAERQLERL